MSNSHYFAQYLLNTGVIRPDEAPDFLARSLEAKPSPALLALREGFVSAGQLANLARTADFIDEARRQNILTEAQIKHLGQVIPEDDLRFSQVLLDEGRLSFPRLEKLFADSAAAPDIIRASVRRLAGENLRTEAESYADFVEIFLRSFIRFMDTPAVIDPRPPILGDTDRSYIVSQRLTGDLPMTTGIAVRGRVFLEMARRYSHEDLDEADELAADSLTEFLNVVNGLFAVDMARQDRDVDLEAPRIESNSLPSGGQQLLLRIHAAFGSFLLIAAADEFLPCETGKSPQ